MNITFGRASLDRKATIELLNDAISLCNKSIAERARS